MEELNPCPWCCGAAAVYEKSAKTIVGGVTDIVKDMME